jgi:threonine synthase
MIYTDTRDKSASVSFRTAVLNGMNEKTGGLYIPVSFPKLESSFLFREPVPLSAISLLKFPNYLQVMKYPIRI